MNEFVWPVRVYYEDTDAGGVVYHANYLKFMERARAEWLRDLGFEQDELIRSEGVVFAVHSLTLDLHRPARFNDRLDVSAKILEHGRASLVFGHEIRSRSGEVLCTGRVKVACLDAAGFRPRPIPPAILSELPGEP